MKNIYQKIIFAIVLSFTFLGAGQQMRAQTYSNSWINFSNTYYKFKIAVNGVYQISKAQLDALGMTSATGNQFAVYRDGVEVPIYVSTSGALGANDYIQLYASMANGKIDTALYPVANFQANPDFNVLGDTASYFLTFDNNIHQRLPLINNPIPAVPPAPSNYCLVKSYPVENYRAAWSPGKSHTDQDYYYSSEYDDGEGYCYFQGVTSATVNVPTPQAYTSGPTSAITFATGGMSILGAYSHPYFSINNITIFDTATNKTFVTVKKTINVGTNNLSSGNAQLRVSDAYNLSLLAASVQYPRTYNFTGNFSNTASFIIPQADRYLEISNFVTNGQTPLLYDKTNNKIYTGTESGGLVKFYLDISAVAKEVYLTNVTSVGNISNFTPVQFRDYSNAANQGDYIILSHKGYINASPNYINDFKTYRASAAGGSHQPVIVDVTELFDQFAYGYDMNPLSVKNFIAYAEGKWTTKPAFMFIIGKGLNYFNYPVFQASPSQFGYSNIVPTWGQPGSDNLLSTFNNSQVPVLATGRLSVWNNQEIGDYLDKVKAYDAAIKPLPVPTSDHELWKKNALHIAGSTDVSLQSAILYAFGLCETVFVDTLIGGKVTTIKKNGTDPVENVNNPSVDSLINKGVGFVSFYGHGSSSGFDYNLNSPDDYNSAPRFPVFGAFACEVSDIFTYINTKTISERYLASKTGGSISMIAGDNTGWTGTLPDYMQNLYKSFSYLNYGKTLGEQYQKNIQVLQNLPLVGINAEFMDIHTQCMLFQGDPAISVYNPAKIDFAVETQSMSSNPTNVTTELSSFKIRIPLYSLGKSTHDSVWVKIQHTRQGNNTVVYSDSLRVHDLLYTDTVEFTVPLDPVNDIGLNNYTVKIDSRDQFDELSEENNQATLQLFIYSENIVPVYPKEFAIVHQQNVTLKASTLNAFAPLRNYKFEIDTTELFNSPLKQSTELASMGGVLKWTPNMQYKDSLVYYWRGAPDTLVNGNYSWANSSFIYLANGTDGWNQSHYFQYLKDEPYQGIDLPVSRKFKFNPLTNTFKLEDKVVDPAQGNYQDVRQSLNDLVFDNYGCVYAGSIQVVVIDSTTGRPWNNNLQGVGGSSTCGTWMFEFPTNTPAAREKARRFIDSIPNGDYVMLKNLIYNATAGPGLWDGATVDVWKSDTAVNGNGPTLYTAVKNLGFDLIDQYTTKQVYGFFRKKGDNNFPVTQKISQGVNDKIEFEIVFNSYTDTGLITSKIVGPALEWKSLKWKTSPTDVAPQNDGVVVQVYGIDTLNHETLLTNNYTKDTSLAFISAQKYPNLKLKWLSTDTVTRTSAYLDYWRVLYSPVPEAALNPAAHFEFTDSLYEGQAFNFKTAIENLTPFPMDSMLVKFQLIDASNVKHDLGSKRYKKLLGNDTLIASLDVDISSYHGANFIYVEANPNNDQPEQYHPNNLGYLKQFVTADQYNPVLDVTFDGVHILDKDIVSAKPMIKMVMRDENKYLPLSDTSLMQVQLMYPGPNQTTPVSIPMDGTICKFFPAQIVNGSKNEARIEYNPSLLDDGVYKLIVSGKDKVGNVAGNATHYEVNFTVENKPSITNVLNYPNPFSTSTQFIFTMTGSEIPSQFKIQIITVTGKVVREIKKYELGDLHIGRNITDYRWDGKDENGQTLGNGVYLYHVVTSIRGNSIEHRDNTTVDKFFKDGYGKLYIMR